MNNGNTAWSEGINHIVHIVMKLHETWRFVHNLREAPVSCADCAKQALVAEPSTVTVIQVPHQTGILTFSRLLTCSI